MRVCGDPMFVRDCILLLYKLGHYISHSLQIVSMVSEEELLKADAEFMQRVLVPSGEENAFPKVCFERSISVPDKRFDTHANCLVAYRTSHHGDASEELIQCFSAEELLTSDDDWNSYQQSAEMLSAKRNGQTVPFSEMSEIVREQNLFSAVHHFVYLAESGNSTAADVLESDAVSRMEHNRWWAVQIANGWKYGAKRDALQKCHPNMVSYEELNAASKMKDAEMTEIKTMLKVKM